MVGRLTNVTGQKCDGQLLWFGAVTSWLWYYIFVQGLYRSLKAGEFHHRVWDLPAPQRHQAFVETGEKKMINHIRSDSGLTNNDTTISLSEHIGF